MNKPLIAIVSCLLGLSACHVEHFDEDCSDPDPFNVEVEVGSGGKTGHAGASSGATGGGANDNAGASSNGGSANAGGDANSAGDANDGGKPSATPTPCQQESDCAPGYNCDPSAHQCLPADEETCGELKTELACSNRRDCVLVYAGLHCSCGQDCACKGGEPGCVCESFEFFNCAAAE